MSVQGLLLAGNSLFLFSPAQPQGFKKDKYHQFFKKCCGFYLNHLPPRRAILSRIGEIKCHQFPREGCGEEGAQTQGPVCHEPPGRRRQQRAADRIQCSEGCGWEYKVARAGIQCSEGGGGQVSGGGGSQAGG